MPPATPPYTRRQVAGVLLALAAYSLWVGYFVGFRSDHVFLMCFCVTCWLIHPATRRFIRAFFIFVVYWIIYDSMRICPNYEVNPIHIAGPYFLEQQLFGIYSDGALLTPNEFIQPYQSGFFDFLAGVFYLNWVPVPLAFAVYLYFRDKRYFLRFSYAFVLTNFIGFVVYYLYPAAPPWYVSQYGLDFLPGTPSNPAGLLRFDELVRFPLFQSIYAKNANIFAAIPSLHSSYPVILVYYGFSRRMGWVNGLFLVFMLGIWFTAVYTDHHYIIDVLAGVACALVSLWLFEGLYRLPRVKRLFENYAASL